MTLKIAINGFGRIGRLVLRALHEHPDISPQDLQIVAINDLTPLETGAYLLSYDSVHGVFQKSVTAKDNILTVDGQDIQVFQEPSPQKLPWKDLDIDIVFECSGRFATRDTAAHHLEAGAKRVLVSAPTKNADLTVVYGVNEGALTADHLVVSNASCTTNCLAPLAQVLHKHFTIEQGFMTTVHAYTGDQRLVDTGHSDPRRARAAGLSMIPTSTGAARAVGLVLPELAGKIDGAAMRVPTANVSVVDFKLTTQKATSAEAVTNAFQEAASGPLNGILDVVTQPLVSCDFNHNPHSSLYDPSQTQVLGEKFCRVVSWYDNEWGFSNRMLNTALAMAKVGNL